jgi:hypothetical protein
MENDQLSLLVENMLELRSNIWELNSRLPRDGEVHPSGQQVEQDTPSNVRKIYSRRGHFISLADR